MFDIIRKFVELKSKLDCINDYKPLTTDNKNQEEKNYFTEPSICLSDVEYN